MCTRAMAKRRKPITDDIGLVKCIKDKDKKIRVQDKNINDELFNEEQGNVIGDAIITTLDENREVMQRIQKS